MNQQGKRLVRSSVFNKVRLEAAILVFAASLAATPALAAGPLSMTSPPSAVMDDITGPGANGIDPDDFVLAADGGDPAASEALAALFPEAEGEGAYSFIHVSDIQLRTTRSNRALKLTRPFDEMFESLHNNFNQDNGDAYYAAYMLKACRAALLQGGPRFLIHTGDAFHAGRVGELGLYNELIQDFLLRDGRNGRGGFEGQWLHAPVSNERGEASHYFNAIGNHDIFYFGNARSLNLFANLGAPGIKSGRFLANYNRLEWQLWRLGRGAGGAGGRLKLRSPEDGWDRDYGGKRFEGKMEAWVPESMGYYSFDITPDGGKAWARMIVINANEAISVWRIDGARYPAISVEQYEWLKGLIERSERDDSVDHVIVFGHQPIHYVAVNKMGGKRVHGPSELIRLFAESPKVIAYLRGDYHKGKVVAWDQDGESHAARPGLVTDGFVEYGVPSIMEYPKCLAHMTVRPLGSGWSLRARYVNLEDLAEAGLADTASLEEKGLVVKTPREARYRAGYVRGGARERLAPFARYLDGLHLDAPDRMLYLAFLCMEGAIADAESQRARGYKDQDNQTWEQWRGPGGNKEKWENEIRVVPPELR